MAETSSSPHVGDITPNPDPTRLTTDAVNQSRAYTKEQVSTLRELVETRLDGMDEAQRLLVVWHDNTKNELKIFIQQEFNLLEERLKSIVDRVDTTDANIDKIEANRLVETAKAANQVKEALDKAENSQKEKFEATATYGEKVERNTNVRIQSIEDSLKLILAERGTYVFQKDLDTMGRNLQDRSDLAIKGVESKYDPVATKSSVTTGQITAIGAFFAFLLSIAAIAATLFHQQPTIQYVPTQVPVSTRP
jgi:hypothetical protein